MFEISSIMLAAACMASTAGLAFLALAMEVHWKQVQGSRPMLKPKQMLLRGLGVLSLVVSLALCLSADHATMAVLVWVTLLAAGAISVAFTLAWRPHWLALLVAWMPQADVRHTANK